MSKEPDKQKKAQGDTENPSTGNKFHQTPPIPPVLPEKSVPDADMRFAPPSAKPDEKSLEVEPLPNILVEDEKPEEPAPLPLPLIPEGNDDEIEIPTTRAKVYTPKEDRYPPIAPPRELPPEIEQSLNLYPEKRAKPKPEPKRGGWLSVVVIFFTVLLTGAIIAYAVFIYQNPYSRFNPLAPPTPFPQIITATFLPSTETPIPSLTVVDIDAEAVQTDVAPTDVAMGLSATSTELPFSLDTSTNTPLPMSTNNAPASGEGRFITLVPSPENAAAATEPASIFPFDVLTPPGVIYAPNGNGRQCEWLSIAGTVVDLNGEPRNGLRVRFINQLTSEENTVFTGSSATFGDGGFEFVISTAPEVNGYFVQLFSQADAPISERITVVTSDKCDQNVAVINFEQVAPF